ncbi:MAG: hypothetical protein WEB52_15610 [Dehalococcoidia bacterium]
MADAETKTDEQAEQPQQTAPAQQLPFQIPPLDMSWAKVPTERPPKPVIGEDGFTLRMADANSYGWVPDHWPYLNDTPRGSWPADDMGLPAPYTIYDKFEVWADNCADLYETAIKEQWKPATQISWSTIEPLAEHIEASLDQIYSNISEQAYNSNQVLMGRLKDISYGYHEVKLYLATQTFDHARHVEACRKRALSNNGGLGVQTPGFFNRAVYAAFKFTEFVIYVNIIRTSFLLGLCEWGEKLARSQADRQLFDLLASDLRRHLAYGTEHLKVYLNHSTSHRSHVKNWLDRGEVMMAADLRRDKPLREAMILALGETVAEGKAKLGELRQSQLKLYAKALEAATVYKREEHIVNALRSVIEQP